MVGKGPLRGCFLASIGTLQTGSVRAVVDGAEIHYWRRSWDVRGDLGGGLERRLRPGLRVFADLRIGFFGEPVRDPPDFLIGDAIHGGAFPLTVGVRFPLPAGRRRGPPGLPSSGSPAKTGPGS